jgi:tetratricopeptide (TPR) repeat protein
VLAVAFGAGLLLRPQSAAPPAATLRQPVLAGPPLVGVTAGPGEAADDREVADIAARLRDALARFDDLLLVRDPAVAGGGGGGQYRLVIARTDGGPSGTLNARLVALPDATVVWRHDFPVPAGGPRNEAWRSAAIRTIASELAQPYGIIPADARSRFRFEGPAGEAYRCLLGGFEYWRKADAAGHLAMRACLLAAARQERPLPAVLAQLTYNHLEEFRHGFNPMEGDPRDRAQAAAERAVAMAPGSARAHQAMLASHFAQRRFDEAFAAGRKAIALNPYDAEIMADIGARYIQIDRIDLGLPLIEEAIGQMAAPPIWARVYLALGHYGDGQRDAAARVADQIVGDSSPLALLARLLAAYHRRDARAISEALRQLREEHPAIDRDPGAYLDRLVISPSLARRLLDSLALARTLAAE